MIDFGGVVVVVVYEFGMLLVMIKLVFSELSDELDDCVDLKEDVDLINK